MKLASLFLVLLAGFGVVGVLSAPYPAPSSPRGSKKRLSLPRSARQQPMGMPSGASDDSSVGSDGSQGSDFSGPPWKARRPRGDSSDSGRPARKARTVPPMDVAVPPVAAMPPPGLPVVPVQLEMPDVPAFTTIRSLDPSYLGPSGGFRPGTAFQMLLEMLATSEIYDGRGLVRRNFVRLCDALGLGDLVRNHALSTMMEHMQGVARRGFESTEKTRRKNFMDGGAFEPGAMDGLWKRSHSYKLGEFRAATDGDCESWEKWARALIEYLFSSGTATPSCSGGKGGPKS